MVAIPSDTLVETAVDATRAAQCIEHVKQNNIAYLVGLFVAHQLGILDKVLLWGSGICV